MTESEGHQKTTRVLVLGHRGMLGHVVRRYLAQQGFRVCTVETRYSTQDQAAFRTALGTLSFDAIVNCAGRKADPGLFEINVELPRFLRQHWPNTLLVHPSSDGVFEGGAGPHALVDEPDATDAYGLSKVQAERALAGTHAVVLRCSIVGPELGLGHSLLAWLIRQKDSAVGFSDQLWNGVTTLDWARLCAEALVGHLALGIHQPGCSPAVSKAELLRELARFFAPSVEVTPVASGRPVDRRLLPSIDVGPISERLDELARWYGNALEAE